MGHKSNRQEIPEESLLKALDGLEDEIIKAAGDDDDSGSGDASGSEDASESMSAPVAKKSKKAKKSHNREDRAPMRALPRSTREANQAIDDDAGTGEGADMGAKSFRSDLRSNGNVRKGMDASSFLEGLCDSLTEEVDGMRKSILYIQGDQKQFNVKLAKAVVAVGNQLQEVVKSLSELGGRPAGVRKSVTNPAEVQQRFGKSMGAAQEGGEAAALGNSEYQFTREQVLAKACDMVEARKLPAAVVTTYEASGTMDEKFQKAIFNELVRESTGGLN